MAVSSPSHLLESGIADQLRFVLTIQQESSLVYPVRTSTGIDDLVDLAGRRVGVWPGHEDLELRWMLSKAGVPDGAVNRVPMTNTVAAFLAGDVDCAQMTTYHELHVVEKSLGRGALRLFAASEYGASLLKDGLLVRADRLAAHREVIQAAVNAVLEGWTIAFNDPECAISICSRVRPDMSPEEHRLQLQDIRKLSCRGETLTRGLGCPAPEHIARVLAAMSALGMTAPAIDVKTIADDSLWQAVPQVWRSKTWAPG